MRPQELSIEKIESDLFRRVSVIVLEYRAEKMNLEIEGKKDVKEEITLLHSVGVLMMLEFLGGTCPSPVWPLEILL